MAKLSEIKSKIPTWIKSDVSLNLITFLLWVISAVFSFYVMAEFQHMILRRYILCCDDRWGFQIVRQWSTIFLVAFWMGFTIITGEYHYQHARQDGSWKVFKWSYVILLLILVIALIL
jgi:hypothetical protein